MRVGEVYRTIDNIIKDEVVIINSETFIDQGLVLVYNSAKGTHKLNKELLESNYTLVLEA